MPRSMRCVCDDCPHASRVVQETQVVASPSAPWLLTPLPIVTVGAPITLSLPLRRRRLTPLTKIPVRALSA